MNRQIRKLGIAIMVLFLLLFIQLNNIQVVQAEKLQDDPRNNRDAVRSYSSPRGTIESADGVILAQSVPSDDQFKQQRQYPEGALFGHLTGFYSFTFGSDGLERQYDDELAGKSVDINHLTDLLTDRVRTDDVTLTITKKLQQVAKDSLGDKRGAVVAIEPKTGAILAMYSNPSYDPNVLASHDLKSVTTERANLLADENNPMLPRAYRESYPPGSTFKVVTSAAAYDHNKGLTTKTYPQLKSLVLPNTNRTLGNFGGETCGGKLPDLLRISCNTGFGQMGLDLGADNLSGEANAFGFNQRPPLDLPAVAKSGFPEASTFKKRQPFLAYSAIGQADVTATPLQMALVAAGIANKGAIMTPHVMKEIRNQHGDVVETGDSEKWLQATSEDTAKSVTENMKLVARAGTATGAQIPGVTIAAKTGTAQTGNNLVNAWLISFAPAEDPQVAVAVVVENQPGVSESTGGRIAAPIAQSIMKEALGK